jgi:hypothetical protein
MHHDPAWQAFLVKARELGVTVAQENSILAPAAFAQAK